MAQVADAGNRVQAQRTGAPARNTGAAAKPPQNPSNGSNAPRDTFTPTQTNGNNSGEELWSTAAAAGRRGAWIGVSEHCAEEAEFCRCSWALRRRQRQNSVTCDAAAPTSAGRDQSF